MSTHQETQRGSSVAWRNAPAHRGSSITWKNAPTQGVEVGGTTWVYRQLGPNTGVPVIFLNHLAAELDRWDPRVVDGIATKRRVIVFDNRGVGASEGKTPTSVEAMARDAVAFIRALGLPRSTSWASPLAASSRR